MILNSRYHISCTDISLTFNYTPIFLISLYVMALVRLLCVNKSLKY